MEIASERAVAVVDRTQIAEARRKASELARGIGLDEKATGRVAIVVTESATNLVNHAGGGQILLQAILHDGRHWVDVLALDRGPGIANVGEALRDGFSTKGSPGTGLGAIVRQSDLFDIHSAAGVGTAMFARVSDGTDGQDVAVGGVCVPKKGQDVCGDGWAVAHESGRVRVLLSDGLGHGPPAAEASARAREAFLAHPRLDPVALVGMMHDALRPTRGAAVAVTDIDRGRGIVRFAGVGNVAGAILAGAECRRMVSVHGTLGHDLRRTQQFEYPWPNGALLVMHSDGLGSTWNLDRYRGLESRASSLIAAILYRDFHRGRDDTTVVVMRDRR
ncbi:MAG: ATP-binding SpoIIE family protein phosphatase [Candidatus Binatia bacterium]